MNEIKLTLLSLCAAWGLVGFWWGGVAAWSVQHDLVPLTGMQWVGMVLGVTGVGTALVATFRLQLKEASG